MKKSFGFGKKNLYLGVAFLVVVGLLSLFVFSGARDGFYVPSSKFGSCDSGKGMTSCLTTAQVQAITPANAAALSSEQLSTLT